MPTPSEPEIQNNISLRQYNTLGFEQLAQHYTEAYCVEQIKAALELARKKNWIVFVLGGGSNIVLSRDIPGLTIRLCSSTIDWNETADGWQVTVDAGTNWHQLVMQCTDKGAFGLENLALIPGTAGAAPIQNIGAYGVELADSFDSLQALEIDSGSEVTLTRDDCKFGYRDSIFKTTAKNRYVITRVRLNLDKTLQPQTGYRALQDELHSRGVNHPTALDIVNTVCHVRQSKLPDPAVIGNAGSFFKNPVVPDRLLEHIRRTHPSAPVYQQADGNTKIAAGWLIETAGWKGHQRGAVGVHDKQALVLTHRGGSDATELLKLAEDIRQSVQQKFSITLEQEPQTI